MEIALRAALIAWLQADPVLSAQLNAVTEEVPSRTALPWLAIAASASADWSAKDRAGREVRLALELHCRGDRPDTAASLIGAVEARIAALPAAQDGFRIISTLFLRARAEQRGANTRAVLIEYRFRVLSD
ncbi:MAG TPA: DUF3168 domain-containing protein [Novosphingobium sp.]|nr:DUF3168 domain-containing protein [Novosphingobium sp.]HQA17293.1 DUF3168 domain-containing protein [Novosphingobium sp.]